MHRYLYFLVFVCLMFAPTGTAQAYVGPGLGAGTLALVLGFIGSIFLALFAVLWYPFKRVLQKVRLKKSNH